MKTANEATTTRPFALALLVLTLLSVSCVPIHKVGRAVKAAGSYEFGSPYKKPCKPTAEQFQKYACEVYGMCGGFAGRMQQSEDPDDLLIISDVRPFKQTGVKRRECSYNEVAFKVWVCPR